MRPRDVTRPRRGLRASVIPLFPAAAPRGGLAKAVAIGGAVFLAIYAGGLFVPSHSYLKFHSAILYHVAPLTALALLTRPLWRSGGRERLGWLCLGLLIVTWDAADWIYSYYDLVLERPVPFPGVPDILYYVGYLAFMGAIPLLVLPEARLSDRRWMLDTAILIVGLGTLSWVYIIQPTAAAEGSDSFGALVALGYPVLDLGLAAAVTVTILRSGSRFTRLAVVLAAAALVQIVSDGSYAYIVIGGGFEDVGNPLDIGWLAAYVLLAVTFVLPAEDKRLDVAQRRSMVGLVLPYVPPVPLAILALLSIQWHEPVSALIAGTIATGTLVVVRQVFTLRDRSMAYWELEETVMMLAAAAEAHDDATGRHLRRVRALSEALARELGYSDKEAADLGLAAVLHDVGKLSVPDWLLTHPGRLDSEAREIMKRHTTWGAEFLSKRPGFELARTVALSHHERWDGSGYPNGLAAQAVPEAAAIVGVADAFDAMMTDRPYRRRLSLEAAVAEIARCSETQFSPRVVEAFLRLWRHGELPVEVDETPAKMAA